MSRRWLLVVTSLVLCQTFVSAAVAEESTAHSLFGNWFGQEGHPSAQQDDRYNQRGSVRQMSDTTTDRRRRRLVRKRTRCRLTRQTERHCSPASAARRCRKRARSRQPEAPSQRTAQLRRTRLKQRSRTALSSTTRSGQTSRPNSNTRANSTCRRQLRCQTFHQTRQMVANTKSATTSSRQSPSRRSAPHMNPGDLRNELSGSFSNGTERANRSRVQLAWENPQRDEHCAGERKTERPKANDLPTPILGKSAATPLPAGTARKARQSRRTANRNREPSEHAPQKHSARMNHNRLRGPVDLSRHHIPLRHPPVHQ